MEMRIDAFLSKSGFASRRNAKDLIFQGRVKINGVLASEVTRIDNQKDVVEVDGVKVDQDKHNFIYIMFNKPLDVLSTTSDDQGRKTILDYVKVPEKVYPVGRLDRNSTGLMLLTNDGDLTLKLTHPRYQVPKKYVVETDKKINEDQVKQLTEGVNVYWKKTLPAEIRLLGDRKFEIVIRQGLKRQVREMCKAVGLRVTSLKRIQIGGLSLGDLRTGEFRNLSDEELDSLL